MEELIQVKAEFPRMLKRRVFAALALRDERFNHWLRTQMEILLQPVVEEGKEERDERLVGPQARC